MDKKFHSDEPTIVPARHLSSVRYEIRGPLARRAIELERMGHEIIKLNIGNPAAFGFRTPETMRMATVENLAQAEGYAHQKGIFPAREAVVMDTQNWGIDDVTADDVFMGNGVSELILMTMEGLLEPGDEMLLPAPDYPLWTAAVVMTGAKVVYYSCRPENDFYPDPEEIERLVSPRTKGIVLINPNNPTGSVLPRERVAAIARVAERHRLVMFSDEIYNRILYEDAIHHPMARHCLDTLCVTFGGLSKVYRACGFRVGWLFFSGRKDLAADYIATLEMLASLRLCSNVPGQWAVQTALGGHQSIFSLTSSAGRLGQQRRALLDSVERSPYLRIRKPMGALYAFVEVDPERFPNFDDQKFALALLEQEHVLVVPGSSFNAPYPNHFRATFLPHVETMNDVFARIDSLLATW